MRKPFVTYVLLLLMVFPVLTNPQPADAQGCYLEDGGYTYLSGTSISQLGEYDDIIYCEFDANAGDTVAFTVTGVSQILLNAPSGNDVPLPAYFSTVLPETGRYSFSAFPTIFCPDDELDCTYDMSLTLYITPGSGGSSTGGGGTSSGGTGAVSDSIPVDVLSIEQVLAAETTSFFIAAAAEVSNGLYGDYRLYLVAFDTLETALLTPPNTGNYYLPAVSPDGTWVLYANDREGNYDLYMRDMFGINEIRLTNTPIDESGGAVWLSDDEIIYSAGDFDDPNTYDLYRMPVIAGQPVALWTDNYADRGVAISPDRSTLVFHSNRSSAGLDVMRLYRYDLAVGGNPVELNGVAGSENIRPYFSPDGQRIVFASTPDTTLPANERVYSIFTIDQFGGDLTYIRENNVFPIWSPDGTMIASLVPGGLYLLGVSDVNAQWTVDLDEFLPTLDVGLFTWFALGE